MLKTITLLVNLIFIFSSCHQDKDIFETTVKTNYMPEIILETNGSILGYVYDTKGNPVKGAVVTVFSGSTTTDQNGIFLFSNIRMDKHGTYIKISKSGFMHGSDMVYPGNDKGLHYSKVKLIDLSEPQKFLATSGGTIQLDGGGKIVFPQDAIKTIDNKEYKDDVLVYAKFLNPISNEFSNEMPGALFGADSSGRNVVLGSAGMFAVELRTSQNQPLQLREGTNAYFEMPVMIQGGPDVIPLWYFDETKGIWIEEGNAIRKGDFYTGRVSHFSFWNCDVPFQLVNVCGRLIDSNGNPLRFVSIKVEAEGLIVTYGSTNSNGFFCGKMPKNKSLKISLNRHNCGSNPDFLTTVGPFENDISLGPFVIDIPYDFSLNGQVLCNNDGVENAIIVVNTPTSVFHSLSGPNGDFDLNLWYFCNPNVEVEIFAYNQQTNEASSTELLLLPSNMHQELNICQDDCSLVGEFFEDCSYTISIQASGGSGNYRYLWDTGVNTSDYTFSRFSQQKTYCVTVTDIQNPTCQQVFCYNFLGRFKIENTIACETPFTPLSTGGIPPFSYIWHDGSTASSIFINNGEEYCVTITDAVGCTAVSCGEATVLYLDNNISNCNKDKFEINFSFYEEAQLFLPGETIGKQVNLWDLSVFTTGFEFRIIATLDICYKEEFYNLPYFSGLEITSVENTTCSGCEDGSINIFINSFAPCWTCVPGELLIFNVTDLSTDLANINAAKMMTAGDYFVVVTDLNTGCYIAFERVVIN